MSHAVVEHIPTPMWGYVYYILSASIITFATWLLYDGFLLAEKEAGRGEGNKATAIILYTISALLIMGGLWHLGRIQ